MGRSEVRHSFKATVVGRVGFLDAPETSRVLTTEPETAQTVSKLLGARVNTAVSGGPIAYLRAPLRAEQDCVHIVTDPPCMVGTGRYPAPVPFGGMGKKINEDGYLDHYPIALHIHTAD